MAPRPCYLGLSRSVRRISRQAAGFLRRAVRLVLLASLWHAPIPWVHAHDLTGPIAEHAPALNRHVAAYHSSEVEQGAHRLELHIHLVLPWARNHDAESPPCPRPSPDSDDDDFIVRHGGAPTNTTLPAAGRLGDRAFGAPLPGVGQVIGRGLVWSHAPLFSVSRGRHFLDTFGRAVSLGDLLGVRLC